MDWKSLLERFKRDESGAATVEFAIVFPVFISIVLSMFESGWVMTKYMMLDRGLDMAMRELRLGELGTSPDEDELKTSICEFAAIFSDCQQEMFLEILVVDEDNPDVPDDFPHGQPDCYDRSVDVDLQPKMTVDNAARRGDVVFVRACLLVNPILPGVGLAAWLPQADSGGHQMVSYAVFMNEPQ